MIFTTNKNQNYTILINFTFLSFAVLFSRFQVQNAALCAAGDKFGENNPDSKTDVLDTNTGYGYMMGEPAYIVDCCGVVTGWEAFFSGVLGTRMIYFQVWRQTSGTIYELVGQNVRTVSADGLQSFSITQSNRITIKSGDRWGWYTGGTDIITYKTGGKEEDNNFMMTMSSLTLGSTNDWNVSPVDDRSYAMRMDVAANSAPSFTNLPSTISIPGVTSSGTSIFTVSVDDVDTYDISSLSLSMNANSEYSFDTSTYILRTTSSLSSAAGVDKLTFVVTDQCTNSATATLTVTVTNDPPVINNLPYSASISEDETVQTLLHTLNVTDPEGSMVTCDLASSVPVSYPFTVTLIPFSTNYGIYSDSSPGFDYSTTKSYSLTVECSDVSNTVSSTFTVYIVQNTPPVFINLQNATSLSTTSKIGDNAFTVLVSDTDDLTFSMTCDPSPCPFEIFDSGQIQVTEDLSDYMIVGYDISITVSDGRNTVGPKVLTITITDINDPVSISNLPSSVSVSENTAIGTTVYSVSYSDIDLSQTHTFSMTSSPSTGLSYFAINYSTGKITVKGSINYETIASTNFVFNVSATDTVSTDYKSLTIDITNENEAPSFAQSSYTISAAEGTAGTIIGSPTFGVSDPDSGDTKTYSLDCGSWTGYFTIDWLSGKVFYQSDYDLDAGSLPAKVNCSVTVTDSGGLTDSGSLTITIVDANDNTPVFSPTAYTFYVSYYAAAGTTVGSVTATDADRGSYGTITYSLDQSSLSVEHFSVASSGMIAVKTTPLGSVMGYATSVTVTCTASDVGGLSDTAIVLIIVSDTTTVITTTTTDRYKTFFEDSRNVIWVCACAAALLISLIALLYVIHTCNGVNGCQQFKRTVCNQRKKRSWKPPRERRISLDSFDRDCYSLPTVETGTVRQPPPPVENQPWRRGI